jgi:hypothetical protein
MTKLEQIKEFVASLDPKDVGKITEWIDAYNAKLNRGRRVGLTSELPEDWQDAVQKAKVPNEFKHLDTEWK